MTGHSKAEGHAGKNCSPHGSKETERMSEEEPETRDQGQIMSPASSPQ